MSAKANLQERARSQQQMHLFSGPIKAAPSARARNAMIRVAADKTFSDGIALLALAYCFGIATGIFLCSGKDKLKKWGQSSKRGSINLSDLLNSGCEEPLARILTELPVSAANLAPKQRLLQTGLNRRGEGAAACTTAGGDGQHSAANLQGPDGRHCPSSNSLTRSGESFGITELSENKAPRHHAAANLPGVGSRYGCFSRTKSFDSTAGLSPVKEFDRTGSCPLPCPRTSSAAPASATVSRQSTPSPSPSRHRAATVSRRSTPSPSPSRHRAAANLPGAGRRYVSSASLFYAEMVKREERGWAL